MSVLQMKYFVLKPAGDDAYAKASRAAMLAFADAYVAENPQMATEVADWVGREKAASEYREANPHMIHEVKSLPQCS